MQREAIRRLVDGDKERLTVSGERQVVGGTRSQEQGAQLADLAFGVQTQGVEDRPRAHRETAAPTPDGVDHGATVAGGHRHDAVGQPQAARRRRQGEHGPAAIGVTPGETRAGRREPGLDRQPERARRQVAHHQLAVRQRGDVVRAGQQLVGPARAEDQRRAADLVDLDALRQRAAGIVGGRDARRRPFPDGGRGQSVRGRVVVIDDVQATTAVAFGDQRHAMGVPGAGVPPGHVGGAWHVEGAAVGRERQLEEATAGTGVCPIVGGDPEPDRTARGVALDLEVLGSGEGVGADQVTRRPRGLGRGWHR